MLRGAAGMLGTAVVGGSMIGCGGGTTEKEVLATDTPTGAKPLPKKGGTANFAVWSQMVDLNPMLRELPRNMVYDHLFNFDYVNDKVDLSLAESLENPDHLTYVFKIRPNAKHQNLPPVNGRSVDSTDVVVSWNAFRDHPRTTNKGIFVTYIDHYETPDPRMLIVKMKKAYAWAIGPHALAGPYPSVIGPRELYEANSLEKVAVGPGAYVLDQFDPASIASFSRRPDGWHFSDRPYVDRVIHRVITDPEVRAAAFKSKQIDSLGARDKLEADLFKTYGPDMTIRKELGLPFILLFRADEQGLFKDVRVREAVYTCLDIRDLIEQVSLGEGEFTGPIPGYLKVFALPDEEVRKYFPHDVAKAKQLLAAAGWDSSREVEFKYLAGSGGVMAIIAGFLQNQLAAAGIKTKLIPQDPATVFNPITIQNKDFQIAFTVAGYNMDPDIILRGHTTQGAGNGNTCRWSDAEVDDIVARQGVEFDKNKQKQLILEAQRMLLRKFTPGINLWCPYSYTGVWGYYHPALTSEMGFATMGHYGWTEKP